MRITHCLNSLSLSSNCLRPWGRVLIVFDSKLMLGRVQEGDQLDLFPFEKCKFLLNTCRGVDYCL